MMKLLGLAVLGASIVSASSIASAHDTGSLTPKFLAAEKAIAEAAQAKDDIVSSPNTSPEEKVAAQTFFYASFKWNRANLTVCFWQPRVGDDDLMDAIMLSANQWTAQANINFTYKDTIGRINRCADQTSADIRVALDQMPVSYYANGDPIAWDWSRYGNLAHNNSAKVSMSLVNVRRYYLTDDQLNFHFTSAHEMGHALGLIHEHQRNDCIQWLDDDGIKQVWPTWTDNDVQIFKSNLQQIPLSGNYKATVVGPPDKTSIMMYNFDQRIWKATPAGVDNPCARAQDVQYPSAQDLKGIVQIYGLKPGAVASPPAAIAAAPPPVAAPTAAPPPPPVAASQTREASVQVLQTAVTKAEARVKAIKGLQADTKAAKPASIDLLVQQHEKDLRSLQLLLNKMDAAVQAAAQ